MAVLEAVLRYVPKTTPRWYQVEALKRAFKCNGRYGLFLKPGTGKTKIAIDFCCALFQQKKANIVLVVCQLTGWPVWQRELIKHCGARYRLVMLPRGSKAQIEALRLLKPDDTRLTFVLINYEATWRIEEALARFPFHILICDEAHKIKNRTAKQSRCIHRLVQVFDPYRVLLTGTPIANKPLDVFSQYMAIDDSVFGRRWSAFANRYATFYGYYNHQVRYKNLSDLRRRARTRASVYTKEECLTLLEPAYEMLRVELDARTWKRYEQMAQEFILFTDQNESASAAIKLTQMLRLSQITGGFITTDEHKVRQLGHAKLDALEDKLEELINSDEKVVVFCRFRPEIDAIEGICNRNKWKSFKYYGYTGKKRLEMLTFEAKFQAHQGPAVFIAQTATGALSIELTAAAYAIFYSFDYSLINWEQCHDRLHRSGQERAVTYYYLTANGTIDEEVYKSLQTKEGVSSLLNNNPKDIVFSDG